MLKYTNTTKTSAQFNGAFFTLAAPEDFASIGDGPTRDAVLKWLAAGNTPVAISAAEIQAKADATATAAAKAELAKIDAQSVRSMREFILAKFPADPLLPPALSGHESAAAIARAKIK